MMHRALTVALVACVVGAGDVSAQEPVLAPDTMAIADTIPTSFPSPRGAFFRALAVPGWGHVHVQEYTRGAVYFTLQSASIFMLVKTIRRLDDVQDRDDRLTSLATDSLALEIAADTALARVLSDPIAYEAALLTYPGLQNARSLARARRQQRQDWITYTLFFTFAAAIDAYVTAHLKDFPADITAQPAFNGGMSLGVSVPVGRAR